MTDDEDESLAHVGHAIYMLLERLTLCRIKLPRNFESLQALDLIINESDRFKIWSSSTGLLIPGHGSLDYRVREATSLTETFRSFLTDLRENFEEVLEFGLQDTSAVQTVDVSADRNSEDGDNSSNTDILDTLLESIKDIINRLFRLATKLRSPETRLRSSRAQKFHIFDNDVDLFECFREFEYDFVSSLFRHYRQGPKLANDAEHTAPPDGSSNLHAVDASSRYLIERLALANVARRRQFAYWKHHHVKLEKHTEVAIASRKVPKSTEVTGPLSVPVKLSPTNLAPAMTISTATQLRNPTQDFDDLASMASVSEYMPSSEGEHGELVIFPPPPNVAAGSKFFECPYCFTICAKQTSKVKSWQAHLIHDLRPYICTYEDCRTPDQLYDIKSDWILHETTSHATTWKCPVHPNEVFEDLVAFRLHAADGHVQNTQVHGSQGAVLTDLVDKNGRSCPICTVSDLPAAQLNDHVAAHLERLAIFSFPKHANTSEADGDDGGSNEANGELDSRGLDMESDLSFDSAPNSVLDGNIFTDTNSSSTSVKPRVEDPQPTTSEDGISPSPESKDRELLLKELAQREETLGPDDPLTLDTVNKLGHMYEEERNLEEAEKMYAQALARRKNKLGQEHPDTLTSMLILARVLKDGPKLDDAERMFRDVLELRQKVLGHEHPDTLNSMQSLARVLFHRHKSADAEQMYRAVVEIEKRVLGEEDPKTLASMENLSMAHQYLNEYTEAEKLNQEVLEIKERVFGKDHPSTVTSMKKFAKLLHDQSKCVEAERAYRVVLERRERVLGKEHVDTVVSMMNLAGVLEELRKYAEAEQMYRAIVEAWKRLLGEEDDDTLLSMSNLAEVLRYQHKYAEAEELYREVWQVKKRTLGEEDPDTQTTLSYLKEVMQARAGTN